MVKVELTTSEQWMIISALNGVKEDWEKCLGSDQEWIERTAKYELNNVKKLIEKIEEAEY